MKSLRILRIVLALAFFACANLFFFGLASGAALVFRFQLLPAVLGLNLVTVGAVVGVTLLCGRVYCSVVCPMGVFQDVVIWLSRRWNGKKRRTPVAAPRQGRAVRLGVLVSSAVLMAFGLVSLGALLDGYSLYGRIATQVFRPLYSLAQNAVGACLANQGQACLFREEVFVRGGAALAVAVAGLVGIVLLAWSRGRFFCNTLCPVGAALSFVATRPLVRISVDPAKCVSCGLCAAACKCGAIDPKAKTLDDAACVRCFNCLSACRKGAMRISSRRVAGTSRPRAT